MDIDFKQILDNLPGPTFVFLSNSTGQIVYGNSGFAETFGGLRTDAIGPMSVYDLGNEVGKVYQRSMEGETIESTIEFETDALSGIFNFSASPYMAEGKNLGMLGCLSLVTNNESVNASSYFCQETNKFYVEEKGTWLSLRECEVFFYILQDIPYPETAKHLGITERTVRAHVNNIKERLLGENFKKSDLIRYAMTPKSCLRSTR